MKTAIFVTLLAVMCLSFAATAQDRRRDDRGGSDRGSVGGASDDYNIIWQRNIFLRNRTIASGPPRTFERQPTTGAPRYAFVLTGIVLQDAENPDSNEYLAFVEDVRAGSTSRFRVGETVGPGKIAQIGFGFIEYETEGQKRRIDIGTSFGYAMAPIPVAGSPTTVTPNAASIPGTSTTPGTGTTGTPASTLPPGGGDLAERMRLRRMQEMGENQ